MIQEGYSKKCVIYGWIVYFVGLHIGVGRESEQKVSTCSEVTRQSLASERTKWYITCEIHDRPRYKTRHNNLEVRQIEVTSTLPPTCI